MILVTGASGLIGSHLLYKLSTSTNTSIRALYRDASKISRVKALFNFYNPQEGDALFEKISWVECNVLDLPELEEQIQDVDYIYHCAAKVSYQKKDFRSMVEINRGGTANLVNMALKHGIKKMCHVSSTAAVGKPVKESTIPIDETSKWNPDIPVSGYSMTKHLSEKEVWRGIEEGLNAVIVNPSVVYGPGDWNESSLTILKTLQKGMKFYPPGSNAFVDARDVANIMVQLMESNITAERYLCVGANTSFKEMMKTAAKHLGTKAPSIALPRTLANIAWRAAKLLSFFTFTPPVLTKDSIANTYATAVFSNEKIKQAIDYKFYTLDEMLENAVKGKL
ncbi:Nucleoside-diphosphate-sugar epimerase [Lishizhenia tianjinensis]|uniref:Nucleoside-diphosphate-sugar epimerase n=1 Tax=Lishizhenia tianjinensis TaxID=477690 RepID=A0A1I6ZZH1_9FLAO|nr:NAD-dependent epimerase/dehydratase family protein [Lishizhenia tianjinensis]SFT68059.1 Nucleoside-diphosphate-sugar epimerase [Lishizhenia tianjinensis]